MATITTLGTGDSGAVSRTTINDNFTNLNTDKVETSAISTDGTLAGNSDTEIPSEKAVKTYVDSQANITIETTTGVTHSLTTTAGQRVIVWAKGQSTWTSSGTYSHALYLNYNGVQKDTVSVGLDGDGSPASIPFSLMYTETPGAGTNDITVTASAGGLSNVVIIVQIIG